MSEVNEHDVVKVSYERADNPLLKANIVGTVVAIYNEGEAVCVEDDDNNLYDVDIESVTKVE